MVGTLVTCRKVGRAKRKPTNMAHTCRLPTSCVCRVTTADSLTRPVQLRSGAETHIFEG